jgi:hypothetical protein
MESKPYRRRYGVIRRETVLPVPTRFNDGGDDAPLSRRGLRIYHWIIGAIVLTGVALILLMR